MCSISGQHEIIDAHWSDCLFVNNKPRVTLALKLSVARFPRLQLML